MNARLRELRTEEFPDWLERSKERYADDVEQNGGMPRELARQKSERDFAKLLPDGLASEGQSLYAVEHEGARVGTLWVAEREEQSGSVLFVYEVVIDQALRGRGLGKQAMALAEQEARARGLARIELNVFGGNEIARNLYRSLGYEECAVFMGKDIS
jgi:ribosomal protein S18 acetylase RimI-like enzyme